MIEDILKMKVKLKEITENLPARAAFPLEKIKSFFQSFGWAVEKCEIISYLKDETISRLGCNVNQERITKCETISYLLLVVSLLYLVEMDKLGSLEITLC